MSGQVAILTKHDNVVLVPKEAVLRQGGQPVLFVVQNGEADLRLIDLGLIGNRHIEILRGVKPGERVVVSGQNLLNQGTTVKIVSE